MNKSSFLLTILSISILTMSCQQKAAAPAEQRSTPDTAAPSAEASGTTGNDAPEDTDAAAVLYEPAYPTEVSSEELSQEDVAQQPSEHSHDGTEEHSHGDGSHDQGEEGSDDDHAH